MNNDADIVLAAFGAGDGSEPNLAIAHLAARLNSSLSSQRVCVSFSNGQPSHEAVLCDRFQRRTMIIPMLASDGVYSAKLRDRLTSGMQKHGIDPDLHTIVAPIGTHTAFHEAVSTYVHRKLLALSSSKPFSPVILGHGTALHCGNRNATFSVANTISRVIGLPVQSAFLEESPDISEIVSGTRSDHHLVILPFMFGGGNHLANDLPARIADGSCKRRTRVPRMTILEPMGGQEVLVEALLGIIRTQPTHPTRASVGARPSSLSRRQVSMVSERIKGHNLQLDLVPIPTSGDRDRVTPLHAVHKADFFTGDIDRAVEAGLVDLAVHSLKDVPIDRQGPVVQAAVLPRGSVADVLVSRHSLKLNDLPSGARVGTSCERRSLQLLNLRGDLIPTPIRGTIEQRIALIDEGVVDAVVLAAAALERLGLEHLAAEHFSLEQLMPAAAQGAIAVHCRNDSPVLGILHRIDDRNTQLAVVAEREFQRLVEEHAGLVAAAVGTVDGGAITLRARVISRYSGQMSDLVVNGTDPMSVGRKAAFRLLQVQAVASRAVAVA